MTTKKSELLEKYRSERTKVISKMLDNQDKNGILPTTRCYIQLDRLFLNLLDEYEKYLVENN